MARRGGSGGRAHRGPDELLSLSRLCPGKRTALSEAGRQRGGCRPNSLRAQPLRSPSQSAIRHLAAYLLISTIRFLLPSITPPYSDIHTQSPSSTTQRLPPPCKNNPDNHHLVGKLPSTFGCLSLDSSWTPLSRRDTAINTNIDSRMHSAQLTVNSTEQCQQLHRGNSLA